MKIKQNHVIEDSGIVFTYHADAMSISWHLPGTNLNEWWSVAESVGGVMVSRVQTEIDMQTEISWFLYKNRELIMIGKSKNRGF